MGVKTAPPPQIFKNLSFTERYAIAVLMVIAAALLRYVLLSIMGATSPYITFYLAIVIAAAIGGLGPGLFVTLAGAGFGLIVILPKGAAAIPLEMVRLGIYFFSGLGISLIAEWMHIYRRKEQQQAQELRRANEEKGQSLAQLEAVINSMDESLVISDLDGQIQTYNPAALRLHGFVENEDARRHISEFPNLFEVMDLEGGALPLDNWPLARVLRGDTVADQEVRVRRRDTGREFIGSYSGSPVRDQGGKAILAIVAIRDVTEQKRAEENLRIARMAAEEANRAKSEFLAKMSHEIRTPMTVVLGSIEHLLELGTTPEERPLLEMAATAAHQLLAIINEVLDIAKIEAHQLEIETRPIDLRQCVGKAVDLFALTARDKGVRLQWEVARDVPCWVEADADRLTQVLVNLIGNAIKFTERGEVSVQVATAQDGTRFTVRDTGIGIPQDKLGAIFEPFNQGDNSRTRRYGGTGLGLTISRELVEIMGGAIAVQSDEGRGSSFTFTLPLPAAVGAAERQPPEITGHAGDRPARVLVAEDEPAVRSLVETTLRRRGWEVDVAENGRQAVDRWEKGGVDIVLMDIKMPEMDGITATRHIRSRQQETGRRPCIVALTAHARPEDREECLAAGMDAFLTKPMRINELESVLKNCLH